MKEIIAGKCSEVSDVFIRKCCLWFCIRFRLLFLFSAVKVSVCTRYCMQLQFFFSLDFIVWKTLQINLIVI